MKQDEEVKILLDDIKTKTKSVKDNLINIIFNKTVNVIKLEEIEFALRNISVTKITSLKFFGVRDFKDLKSELQRQLRYGNAIVSLYIDGNLILYKDAQDDLVNYKSAIIDVEDLKYKSHIIYIYNSSMISAEADDENQELKTKVL